MGFGVNRGSSRAVGRPFLPAMSPSSLALPLSICLLLVSCASKPTVNVVFSDLSKAALRGKTVAVGGFAAESTATYPGQVMEAEIVKDAGILAQRRLRKSNVLTSEEAMKLAGPPPAKLASKPSMRVGSRLTSAFVSHAHAHGIDYLLWIRLSGSDVRRRSRLWRSTRTEYSSCSCGDVTENGTTKSCRSAGSCRSGCCSSCSRGEQITEYHNSESITRRLSASHELIDTGSGRCVWRADSALSRLTTNTNTSRSGFPLAPPPPLPDEESLMMRCMARAVMDKLPR